MHRVRELVTLTYHYAQGLAERGKTVEREMPIEVEEFMIGLLKDEAQLVDVDGPIIASAAFSGLSEEEFNFCLIFDRAVASYIESTSMRGENFYLPLHYINFLNRTEEE